LIPFFISKAKMRQNRAK